MVCDIQEIFRSLIEDFLVGYHKNLEPGNFEEKGKRIFLKPQEKLRFILEINKLFKQKAPYNRRQTSKKTMIRTIIKEETIKLGQFIRRNTKNYKPLSS